MFRLENVTKEYTRRGETIVAFRAESLQIGEGEYAAIVGSSGSGKSTLLSLLGGMLSPTTGKIWCGDESLYDLSVGARARVRREMIGFVFQTFNLVPYLTAMENVQVPLCLAGVAKDKQLEYAEALLVRVGLKERMQHRPRELSAGQQQRVALARTLANIPKVVLADEPTGNLDPESRGVVLDFFDHLHAEGCTIVMVTHDPIAAERAERKLVLRDGTVTNMETDSFRQVA